MKKLLCYMSSTHMRSEKDWTVSIREASEIGFAGVELFGSEDNVPFDILSEERCDAISKAGKQYNMRLSVHPWISWESLPEDELSARYAALVNQAVRIGIKEINMHLHFLAGRKDGMPRVIRATKYILPLLEKNGIMLYYENVPEHGKRELGSELWDFKTLFDTFSADTPIGMNIDNGHAHIMHEVQPLIEEFGDRWLYTHINDNDGLSDLHAAPGNGTCDFAMFARLSNSADYSGPLMMEYHQNGLEIGMRTLTSAYLSAGYELPVISVGNQQIT